MMSTHKAWNAWGCRIASGKRIMILADVFCRIQKQMIKNCSARHLSKQGDLYRVENFSQLMSLSEPGTSPGQEKERGCGHPVYWSRYEGIIQIIARFLCTIEAGVYDCITMFLWYKKLNGEICILKYNKNHHEIRIIIHGEHKLQTVTMHAVHLDNVNAILLLIPVLQG